MNQRILKRGIVLLALLCAGMLSSSCTRPNQGKTSVLFICVDDLRPTLGCYGTTGACTPNLDRLASSGTRFDRAYCQMATCAPSRASVLTGCRPDTTGVRDLTTHYRDALPDVVILPELFKQHGYFTAALGKVHHGPPTGPLAGKLDDPRAWSVDCWRPERWQTYYASAEGQRVQRELEEQAEREAEERGGRVWAVPRGLAWDVADVNDSELGDGMIADRAIELLREHKDGPFFLAVGFLKPHMPYVVPERYWDMHTAESLPPLIDESTPPGAPAVASTDSSEVRAHFNVPKSGPFSPGLQADLVHAYYACVSYVDAQVGRVLHELDELGLAENTIVVVWGDHGWHLGEQGLFGKHTNYEAAVRSPLLIRVPGREQVPSSDALVELVDLYPSLAELCGLPLPATLEGTSFVPQLETATKPGKTAVFHQYSRSIPGQAGQVEGHAIRTDDYRFVEWRHPNGSLEQELYDLRLDAGELQNIVESEPEVARALQQKLAAGWRAVRGS